MSWYLDVILWVGTIRTVGVGKDFLTLNESVLDAIANAEDSIHIVYDDHTMTAEISNDYNTIYNQYIVGYGDRKVIQGCNTTSSFRYVIGKVYLENIHLVNNFSSRWLCPDGNLAELHTNQCIIDDSKNIGCINSSTLKAPTVKLHSTKLTFSTPPTVAFTEVILTNVYLDKVSYEGAYTEASCTGLKALDDKAITGTSGYGEDSGFSGFLIREVPTLEIDVTTLQASNITQSNFIANGSIDSIGEGITVVKRGFCYKVKE